MARGRTRKTEKGNFSREAMETAVNLVINEKLPLREAADRSGVKYPTLYRYVKKKKNSEDQALIRMTPNYACRKIFTAVEEQTIADYAIQCTKMCYGKSRKDIRDLACELAVANSKEMPISWRKNKKAGIEWLHGFMHRHPNLSIRQPEACSLSRMTSFNKHNVGLFFENLELVYSRNELFANGTRVFNLDETSTTTVQQPRKIVAKKGIKQVNSATSAEWGILITTCCIISANGTFLPPAMIFPRKKFKEHMLHGAPPATLGLASSSGWMTVELFVDVVKHFIRHSSSNLDNPSVLIMDNHESHLSIYVLELAKSNGVTILTLPPHCSHRLQPLDVTVFYPFKSFYNNAVELWLLRHPGRPLTIYDVAECVGVAFEKAMAPTNISSSFKKSGIFPFNKNVFSDDDFAISKVTDREVLNETDISEIRENENKSPIPEVVLLENKSSEHSIEEIAPNTSTSTFMSPAELKGYPKAVNLKQKSRSRKKKSIIATDTPEKNAIEEKAMEKFRKCQLTKTKNRGKRKVVESSDEESEIELDDNSSDNLDISDNETQCFMLPRY